MKNNKLFVWVGVLLILGLASCEYEVIQPETVAPADSTKVYSFASDIMPMLKNLGCANCHPSAGGFDLSDAKAYESVKSKVTVATPETSAFYTKITGTTPHAGKILSTQNKADLLEWIKQGAKE